MASVLKRAVYGSLPNCHRATRLTPPEREYSQSDTSTDSMGSSSSSLTNDEDCGTGSLRKDEILRYEDSDEEESMSTLSSCSVSHNFVDLISQRSIGCNQHSTVDPEFGTRHLLVNGNFREKGIAMGEMNKIFCSSWLNSHQIVFGSKCNRVFIDFKTYYHIFHNNHVI